MSTSAPFPPETIQAYILGKLDAEQAAQIEAASEGDKELAAELAIWAAARDLQVEDAASSDPGAFGWARIERAIDAQSAARSANDNSPSGRPVWFRNVIAPWQAAAAVAAAVLGWQVAVVPAITNPGADEAPAYELASGGEESEFTLRIAFTDTATEADLRAVLREVDARIVDGPSAIGLYTLSFADEAAKERAAQILAEQGDIVAEVAE